MVEWEIICGWKTTNFALDEFLKRIEWVRATIAPGFVLTIMIYSLKLKKSGVIVKYSK